MAERADLWTNFHMFIVSGAAGGPVAGPPTTGCLKEADGPSDTSASGTCCRNPDGDNCRLGNSGRRALGGDYLQLSNTKC